MPPMKKATAATPQRMTLPLENGGVVSSGRKGGVNADWMSRQQGGQPAASGGAAPAAPQLAYEPKQISAPVGRVATAMPPGGAAGGGINVPPAVAGNPELMKAVESLTSNPTFKSQVMSGGDPQEVARQIGGGMTETNGPSGKSGMAGVLPGEGEIAARFKDFDPAQDIRTPLGAPDMPTGAPAPPPQTFQGRQVNPDGTITGRGGNVQQTRMSRGAQPAGGGATDMIAKAIPPGAVDPAAAVNDRPGVLDPQGVDPTQVAGFGPGVNAGQSFNLFNSGGVRDRIRQLVGRRQPMQKATAASPMGNGAGGGGRFIAPEGRV